MTLRFTMPPPADHPAFRLQVLQQIFDIKQYPCDRDILDVLDSLRASLNQAGLFSLTRTAEEVSIVHQACEGEGRWKCIKILGPMDFGLTGVMCNFTAPLKEAKIPVFVISTWNTDYVLIPAGDVDKAVAVLAHDGWQFV